MTDFSLYSIGIRLLRSKRPKAFLEFVEVAFARGRVQLVRLEAPDLERLVRISQRFHLDFDDAYQYTIAEKHNLAIVSYDGDFDLTERGRRTPAEILQARKLS